MLRYSPIVISVANATGAGLVCGLYVLNALYSW